MGFQIPGIAMVGAQALESLMQQMSFAAQEQHIFHIVLRRRAQHSQQEVQQQGAKYHVTQIVGIQLGTPAQTLRSRIE
ncbi:hypothetical protein D3C81_594320 [compost metagenome]